jgi:hypothetical protein
LMYIFCTKRGSMAPPISEEHFCCLDLSIIFDEVTFSFCCNRGGHQCFTNILFPCHLLIMLHFLRKTVFICLYRKNILKSCSHELLGQKSLSFVTYSTKSNVLKSWPGGVGWGLVGKNCVYICSYCNNILNSSH